uniref:Uncharacterized protein TCIL3000_10_8850 n=1 Tax=Trypanosoma congolense (strain IL3000) TaxID=1068625 RepID=G0UXJ1_TRYCI|nr:unnamed protein product [Trypanosoma congolense IL3000]
MTYPGVSRSLGAGKRTLPSFDNHYNSGVLVDNWFDTRINEAHGSFTVAVDDQLPPSCSVYKEDFVGPGSTAIRPMMRNNGLGKELILGDGVHEFSGTTPTSSEYGATQRHLIDSKYGKSTLRRQEALGTAHGTSRIALTGSYSRSINQTTIDDRLIEQHMTTKKAMDIPIECYHVQRQMPTKITTIGGH